MSKAKKIVFLSTAIAIATVSIFMIFWYFGESYQEFYAKASKAFEIPGLSEGFVPQGLCYNEKINKFLTSGYMQNGSASRIYVVNAQNGKTEKYFTLKIEDTDYVGHAGGIASKGDNVWVSGDGLVVRFKSEEIEAIENGGIIFVGDFFNPQNGADFIAIEDNNLWVGEFHKPGKYDTDSSHVITTSNGKTNSAISFCYEIAPSKEFGIDSTIPTKALSTPSLVQGMIVSDNKIILSTSYSLPKSHIYTYENITTLSTDSKFIFGTAEIPLYILSDDSLVKDLEAPCMSEEIALVGEKVFVLFESACKKYSFVTRESLRHVYTYKI